MFECPETGRTGGRLVLEQRGEAGVCPHQLAWADSEMDAIKQLRAKTSAVSVSDASTA